MFKMESSDEEGSPTYRNRKRKGVHLDSDEEEDSG